jgi:DNA helicase-2/ATP-dependent DNA helicase PcrA
MLEQEVFPARAQAALAGFRKLIEELRRLAERARVDELLRQVLQRTGYWRTLEGDESPEAQARLENLKELINAGAEAAEQGEGVAEFLDHAALVSDADAVDERAQVSLLTVHNAKGLEFPVVFIAGLEQGLFPHSRSQGKREALEEERRLCYVGMTRAQKQLVLSWARERRRWAGGDWQACEPSQFLLELPSALTAPVGEKAAAAEVDLFAEQEEVREAVQRRGFAGQTYDSLENITEFFAARGKRVPLKAAAAAAKWTRPAAPKPGASATAKSAAAAGKPSRRIKIGAEVIHPHYGRGCVVRREGEGETAKITVSFHKHGLKKLIERYAALKVEE